MKNEFKIQGDTTIIYAHNYGVDYEVLIDTSDLQIVSSIDGTWQVAHRDGVVGCVVFNKRIGNGKRKTMKIHRLITDCPEGLVIDHRNRNPLDNRKTNLKICTHDENKQNRNVNRNNKGTGVRGLYKHRDKFRARVQVNGERVEVGIFDTIEEGTKALKEFRTKNTTSID